MYYYSNGLRGKNQSLTYEYIYIYISTSYHTNIPFVWLNRILCWACKANCFEEVFDRSRIHGENFLDFLLNNTIRFSLKQRLFNNGNTFKSHCSDGIFRPAGRNKEIFFRIKSSFFHLKTRFLGYIFRRWAATRCRSRTFSNDRLISTLPCRCWSSISVGQTIKKLLLLRLLDNGNYSTPNAHDNNNTV